VALTKKQLEYQREWRKQNPKKFDQQQQKTKESLNRKLEEDLNFFVNYTYKSLKSGASARNISFRLSKRQLYNFVITHPRCELSGRLLTRKTGCPNRFSVDRINSRYGYSIKNIQAVVRLYNMAKGDNSDDVMTELCKDVAKHSQKK